MYIMVALLVVGFICNYLVKPVADKYYATNLQEATV
jgi:hypothetical protein